MANQYLDDLIQNIYTNCDMKGFDDYNRGVQDLSRSMSSFNADTIRSQKQRISLVEAETKSQIRLADYQDKYARKKKQRDEEEIRRMQRRNGLQRYFTRLLVGVFSIQAIKGMFDTASRIQLVQKSIQGLTKDTQDWDYIQRQAFEKGIDLEVVAKGYRNFYSSAKMAGFDKGGIQQMYSDMLLSTRAIGASTQQTEGALLALEQMLSKGRVSMEELRRQMGNAIPGAFEIGARAMNMTTAEFNNFVQKVGIASSEFVPKFIKQLKEEYAGGFKGISETLSFATTRLSVAWKLFQLELFEGETGKSFARMIDSLAKLMVSPEFKQFAKNLGQILELIVKILSFAISHIRTILVLIGTGGIMAVLPQIAKYLKLIGLGIGFITSTGILNGIRILVGSFWAMFAPMAALYGKILLVVSALIILKDVYDAIVHPDWDSLTRREWEGKNTTFGASQSGLNPFGTPQTVKQKMQEYEKLKTRPMEMYSSPSAGLLNGSLFNKSEQKNVNISLGDINVNSQNGNPMQIAQAVQEQLVALFTGQGLTMDVQGTVV